MDLFLPTLNTVIEYDGEQHSRPAIYGGMSLEKATENFKRTQAYDAIKDAFCAKNGIVMIRINYDEKVGNKLKEELTSNRYSYMMSE